MRGLFIAFFSYLHCVHSQTCTSPGCYNSLTRNMRGSFIAFFSCLHCVLSQTCTSPGSLRYYNISPRPTTDPFTNMDTLGPDCELNVNVYDCFANSLLIDNIIGPELSPPNASVMAWRRSQGQIRIEFAYRTLVQVDYMRLFFYHVPSMGIGLPQIALDREGVSSQYYVAGNQYLNSTDARRRNIVLSYATTVANRGSFGINFDFTDNSNVDWLLLSEVQLCSGPTNAFRPSTAPVLVNATPVIRTSDEVSPNLTLSCTVSGEGKFSWTWTGPQSPVMVWISDVTRTSTAMFTGIRRLSTDDTRYRCEATYDPIFTFPSFTTSGIQEFSVDFQFSFDQIGSRDVQVVAGSEVTLACELYGYLLNSVNTISWNMDSNRIDNSDLAFTIITMDTNKLIQNGGQTSVPGIISQLTFTTNPNVSLSDQQYSCVLRENALFFFVDSAIQTSDTPTTASTEVNESTVVSTVLFLPNSVNVLLVVVVILIFIIVSAVIVIIIICSVLFCLKYSKRTSKSVPVDPIYELPNDVGPDIVHMTPSDAYGIMDSKKPNEPYAMVACSAYEL